MTSLCLMSSIVMRAKSGLKARATLAWGNAPGKRPFTDCGLKARAKRLIPRKPPIERNTVFGKHRPHLGLKIPPGMVLFLVVDVPDQSRPVTQADGEGRIPALPPKLRELRALGLDPFCRRDLQAFDLTRYRFRSRLIQHNASTTHGRTARQKKAGGASPRKALPTVRGLKARHI